MAAPARPAVEAAVRLHRAASALLVVTSVLFGITTVIGVALIGLSDAKGVRITGVVMAAGGVIAWLTSAVFCTACQAVAAYIRGQ